MTASTRQSYLEIEPVPVAVYDIEKKKLMFVFYSMTCAYLHLYSPVKDRYKGVSKLKHTIDQKSRTKATRINKVVAVRCASKEQRELVKDVPVYISDDYQLDILPRYKNKGAQKLLTEL